MWIQQAHTAGLRYVIPKLCMDGSWIDDAKSHIAHSPRISFVTLTSVVRSMRDSDPPDWHSIFCDFVRLRRWLPRWECPSRPAWLVVVQLAFLPHQHLHDGNSDEVTILPHVSLSLQRSRGCNQSDLCCCLSSATNDVWCRRFGGP